MLACCVVGAGAFYLAALSPAHMAMLAASAVILSVFRLELKTM